MDEAFQQSHAFTLVRASFATSLSNRHLSVLEFESSDYPLPHGLLQVEHREALHDLVSILRQRGDAHIHYRSGLDLFGAADEVSTVSS